MKRLIPVAILFVASLGLNLGVNELQAQPYPSRPIQFIIPNVAGSIMDINSRALCDEWGRILGTQIIPVNKPGAATTVGTEALARSKKDGYTLGYVSNAAMVYARILNPETIHFDPNKDVEPLGNHLIVPLAIAVRADAPWKTFNDLLDDAKKNPGKIRIDTIGVGSPAHFNLEIIQSLTGAQFTHVPFKGGESVITALLGGHLEATFDAINKIVPHVESGKLRVLLLTNKMPEFPNIPTFPELGFKQELGFTWFAVYAPSGLPEDIKNVLVTSVEKAIKHPQLKARFEKMQFIVSYKSPAEQKKMVSEEYERAVQIADKVGLRKKG
jgi:tripartite-type tricarboxylate transporter receptor subunit TctC